MAAHLLRLRAALLVGAFRGAPAETARRLVVLVLVAAAAAATGSGLASLADLPAAVATTGLVVASSAVTLAFAVGPALAAGTDPLDPRRFRTLGSAPSSLAAAIPAATLVSVPGALLVAFDAVAVVAWARLGTPVLVALAAGVLHVALCVLVERVVAAAAALLVPSQRGPDASGLFLVALVVAVVPAIAVLAEGWDAAPPAPLRATADVLVWTPLGVAAGLPRAAGEGDAGAALGAAALGVALLALLGAAWARGVERILTTVDHPVAGRENAGLGWFGLLPATAAGAIAARSLVYGLRDSRYLANVVVIPVAGVLAVVPLLVAGVPIGIAALVPVPVMALFYGWLPHNDLAFDSSAVWLHIASGVRGVSDRVGRLAPVLVVAVPVLVVAVPSAAVLSGTPGAAAALTGLAAALLLSGLGLSSIASAALPYPVSQPGDGPFQQPQRTASTGVWAQAAVLVGTLVVSAPAAWTSWQALDGEAAGGLALAVGIGTGVVVLVAGVAGGAAVFDTRGTRLMEFAAAA